jgi:DNA repair protein SbcD/Mre11
MSHKSFHEEIRAMIRFFHTSDWHLGRFLYGHSLLDDQSFILDRLIELIDEKSPHALLISGDIFDRSLPPESAVVLFDSFLRKVATKRRLPIFIIPGNHDSNERLGFAASLLRELNVTIFAQLEDSFSPVRIEGDKETAALIYGIPFVEPLLIGRLLGREDVRSPDAAISLLCRSLIEKKPEDLPAVLLCHAFVAGGEVSESEKEIFIGGSSQVDTGAFEGFAYTALGHLHKPQTAGSPNVRYSGSLLPYSKSEIGHLKSITEVQLQASGKVETILHELPQRRALRYIEGELQTLIAEAQEKTGDSSLEDYIIAGYTDRGAVLDAFARLRLVYPQLLHIARAGGFEPTSLPAMTRLREKEKLSELDLFAEFFRDATGTDLTDPERDTLIEALNTFAGSDAGVVSSGNSEFLK